MVIMGKVKNMNESHLMKRHDVRWVIYFFCIFIILDQFQQQRVEYRVYPVPFKSELIHSATP